MNDREAKVRQYLKERFRGYQDSISLDDALDSIVDSLGLFELVEYIEQEFRVSVPMVEFSPRRFSSIRKILQVIEEFSI
jgi:acyl carrier protein